MPRASIVARAALVLGWAIGALVVPGERVAACDCGGLTPEEAARAADVVFSGTVTEISEAPVLGRLETQNDTSYEFAVDRAAKGDVGLSITLLAAPNSGAGCGIGFGADERWLIFAAVDDGWLTTHQCAGDVPLGPSEEPPIPMRRIGWEAVTAVQTAPGGAVAPAAVVVAMLTIGAAFVVFRRVGGPR